MVRVQQKLGRRCSSSFQLFSCLALEVPVAAREYLSAFVYLFALCTLVFSSDVSNIILLSVITMYLYFSVGMYIITVLPPLILACTNA